MVSSIDVVIPTKNRATLVRQAIDSVLRQNFGLGRLVIIDDGSDSPIEDGLDSDRKARCTVIRSEQSLGVSASRNIGIDATTSDWILFLDDDDWLHTDYLQNMIQYVSCDHPNLAFAWPCRILTQEETGERKLHNTPAWDGTGPTPREVLSSMMEAGCSGLVVKRESLVTVGTFNESLKTSEDRDLVFRLLEQGFIGIPAPKATVYIRVHSGLRLSDKTTTKIFDDSDLRVIENNRSFLEQHPDLAEKFIGRVAKRLWKSGHHEQAITAIDFLCRIKPFSVRHRKRQVAWRATMKIAKTSN